jgi:alkanesulfonate monooxygenase SsuD/methylene tetrahydromethanopterin reductase-like flavin-dependent oxidoreductase (luciferase family)
MELGVYTFAELTPDPETGRTVSAERRLADLVEEIELAERVGLDVFGVGEHHRPDFSVSAPAIVLAAGAARTERIRLTSAVSVISSDDPVRVFQDFATLDLLSGGRAEIMAGRGSFVEFPLFGFDLGDYDDLFAEKLQLLLALRDQERVTWSGRHRPPLVDLGVYPRPLQDPLPVWLAAGGNPPSAIRAGRLGLPLALAIIGGQPERFVGFAELHRRAAADDAAGLRRRPVAARRQLRRQPAGRDRQDPLPARDLRPPALSAPVLRRHAPARPGHALDRVVRHRGRAGGSRAARGVRMGGCARLASLSPCWPSPCC